MTSQTELVTLKFCEKMSEKALLQLQSFEIFKQNKISELLTRKLKKD